MESVDACERHRCLRVLKSHYCTAGCKAKGEMLKSAEQMPGSHRKHMNTLLHSAFPYRPLRGRGVAPMTIRGTM